MGKTIVAQRLKLAPQIVALLLLAACKAGTTTGTNPTPGPTPPPTTNYASPFPAPAPIAIGKLLTSYVPPALVASYDAMATNLLNSDVRYLRQASTWYYSSNTSVTYSSYPLRSSGIAFAHAAGLTGSGETVGVVDTMLNPNHEVFAGTTFAAIDNGVPDPINPTSNHHGTMVSSIIAGDSSTFIGVAPGASLDFATFQNMTSATNATIRAYNNNYVAQNNSWGFDSRPIGQTSFNAVFSGAGGQAYLTALDNYASRGVVVFAVSNDQTKTNATIMDALPYVRPGLEAGWIAAGNATPTFQNGTISSVTMQSAGCMEAARWCILADGAWTAADSNASNTSYTFGIGSSFAAPQVAGALALLAEAFPTLTPHELRARLLASANDDFFGQDGTVELATGYFKRYSFKYGVGFLDVRAALLPIGPTAMSLPNGIKVNTDRPVVVAGSALGDAVARSLQNVDVTVTDALDTPFGMDGSRLSTSVAPEPLGLRSLSRSLASDLTRSRTGKTSVLDTPFASFSGQTWGVEDPTGSVDVSVLAPAGSDQSYGVNVNRLLSDGPTRLEVGVKFAHDSGAVMGLGGTSGDGANLASVALGVSQDLGGGGFLALSGEVGMADLGTQVAMNDISQASFNSVKLDIGSSDVFGRGDRLSLSAGLPIAVTSGRAQMVLPVYGPTAHSISQPIAIDLAPSNRQVDLALTYQREVADNLEMMAQLLHSENYGNRAGISEDAAVIGFKLSF